MTVKKVAIIAAAGAVLLAGALTLSMTLITRNKIEVTATETLAQNETGAGRKRRKNVGKYGEYAALF